MGFNSIKQHSFWKNTQIKINLKILHEKVGYIWICWETFFSSCKLWLWEVYNSQLYSYSCSLQGNYCTLSMVTLIWPSIDCQVLHLLILQTLFFLPLPQTELSCLAFTPQGMFCLSGLIITVSFQIISLYILIYEFEKFGLFMYSFTAWHMKI